MRLGGFGPRAVKLWEVCCGSAISDTELGELVLECGLVCVKRWRARREYPGNKRVPFLQVLR